MPLVRIDLRKGKPAVFLGAISRRTEDLVIIQITWNEGRTVEQKKAL
jgi:Tautomerase enzyme